MLQRRPTWTPSLVALVSIAAFCAASTAPVRAADECIAKPNAPAPQGQHWYYRTDRNTNRQCWYLASRGMSAHQSATETESAAQAPKTPAVSSRASQAPTTEPTAEAGPAAAASNGFAPAAPPPWPEAAGLSGAPPSVAPAPHLPNAGEPRLADSIEPAPTPASHRAELQQLPANVPPSRADDAAAAVSGDHTFALIMLASALLAIAGPVLHATRGRRRRNVGDHDELRAPGPATLSASDARATARDLRSDAKVPPLSPRDRTQDVVETLQRLLDEMQARRYARGPTNRVGHLA